MKPESPRTPVIGNFARLVRGPTRYASLDEPGNDAPPERFVEKVSDEGGDVYIAPMLEALRAALARARRAPSSASDASSVAPEGASQTPRTEGAP